MANICENTFYACGHPDNITAIDHFFDDWKGIVDVSDIGDDYIEVYFDSKWTYPEEEMDKLYESLPVKEDLYMRCLSVEYGCEYVGFHVCRNIEGWIEIV